MKCDSQNCNNPAIICEEINTVFSYCCFNCLKEREKELQKWQNEQKYYELQQQELEQIEFENNPENY